MSDAARFSVVPLCCWIGELWLTLPGQPPHSRAERSTCTYRLGGIYRLVHYFGSAWASGRNRSVLRRSHPPHCVTPPSQFLQRQSCVVYRPQYLFRWDPSVLCDGEYPTLPSLLVIFEPWWTPRGAAYQPAADAVVGLVDPAL